MGHRSKNVVIQPSESTTTREIRVQIRGKSTDNSNPHSIYFLPQYQLQRKFFWELNVYSRKYNFNCSVTANIQTTKETLILQIEKDPAWADNPGHRHPLQDFYTRHIIPAFTNDLL